MNRNVLIACIILVLGDIILFIDILGINNRRHPEAWDKKSIPFLMYGLIISLIGTIYLGISIYLSLK